MPVRYSDLRLQLAARAKFKCLEGIRQAAQTAGVWTIPAERLKKWLPTNDVLDLKAKEVGFGIADVLAEAEGKPRASEKDFPILPGQQYIPEVSANTMNNDTSESDNSSDSESSSTSNSAAYHELRLLEKYDTLSWAIPPHKNAQIHIVTDVDATRIACLCGQNLLYKEAPGKGLRELLNRPNRKCARCVARLDNDLSSFLRSA